MRIFVALALAVPIGSVAAAQALPIRTAALVPARDSFAIRANGLPLGSLVTAVEVTADGFRIRERSRIEGLVEQETTVELDRQGAMLRVRQSGQVQGEQTVIELDYNKGGVKGRATTVGPNGPVNVTIDTTLTDPVVDDNAIQGLVPTLPWAPDSRWTFRVFSGGQNETALRTLQVTGTSQLPLGAGQNVDAYLVDLTGGPQTVNFWVSRQAPFRLLKIAIAGTPVEIVRVE
ncbi:MAG: DUF3108 domain-containing protein [Gemmatimonadales bacterium]